MKEKRSSKTAEGMALVLSLQAQRPEGNLPSVLVTTLDMQFRARTADTVIFETVLTLQRSYGQPKAMIREAVLPLIELPGIVLPGKRRFRKVFDLYVDRNLPFADAYHTVMMEQLKLVEIVTFDKEFDRVPGIRRVSL